MEPMNCVVKLGPDRCEIWNGEHFKTDDQKAVAQLLGSRPSRIVAEPADSRAAASAAERAPRRTTVLEAATIAKAIAAGGEGQLCRQARSGRARTTCARATSGRFYHTLKAALDADGTTRRVAAPDRRPVDRRGHSLRAR
jgi:isoquinoline 1-oxidoreductase beta subunit